jgi:hypothetical protein
MSVNVVLKAIWDDKGIKEAEKAFGNFGKNIDKAFKAVAVGVGLATAAFAKFGADAIKQASNLAESTNAVNVAFGQSARAVLAIGESSAESLGLARSEFNSAAVRFSAFAERVVGQGGDVAGFIGDITQRAADFASVFNIDVAEALQVFQSGLAGEAEPLKRFGINLLDSEVKAYALRAGIVGVGEAMTETQKVQARFGLLMEATSKTAGDFANTSEGLANQQRILTARFTDLQAEVGTALLPAVTNLVGVFADRLIPVFEEFGDFLASPQGKKIIEDTATTIANLFEFIADNITTIVDFALKIAAAITALKLLKTALELASIAQAAFNLIVKANPYVLAASAIFALIGGLKIFTDALVDSGIVKEKDLKSSEALTDEIRRLEEAHEDGLIPTDKFKVKLAELEAELKAVQGAAMNVDLSKLRGQFGDTRVDALRLVNAQRQLYYAMKGLTPPPLPGANDDTGGGGGGGGGGGQSDREKAFERVQKIIKDAQKKIRDAQERYREAIASAQKTYNKTIAEATKTYSEAVTQAEIQRDKSLADALKAHNQNISAIQRDFANRQADIIQQSIDRLRDAYASAVRANVADLFGTDEVGKSIDKLITTLRDRLTASRTLVSNTALLASRGFSQTFLEQVVSSGLETGNELSKAILEATPETQKELQSLFGALETESESGMDTLAKTIFEKTGLATTELKRLFSQTNTDLAEALKQAQIDYTESQATILTTFDEALTQAQKARDEAFTRATDSLNEALASARDQYLETLEDIREAFDEQIKALEEQLGGLGNTVKQFLAMLAQLATAGAPKISTLPSFPSGGVTPVIQTLPLTPQKPTVVNNNTFLVKQDATQSPSMTGAAISKAINKYVGGGGGLNRGIAAV